MVIYWIVWIRLFDFDVYYVLRKKNAVINRLLRKPLGPSDLAEQNNDDNIKAFINSKLDFIYIFVYTKSICVRAYSVMTVDNTQATKNKDRPVKEDQDQPRVIKDNEETEQNPEDKEKL